MIDVPTPCSRGLARKQLSACKQGEREQVVHFVCLVMWVMHDTCCVFVRPMACGATWAKHERVMFPQHLTMRFTTAGLSSAIRNSSVGFERGMIPKSCKLRPRGKMRARICARCDVCSYEQNVLPPSSLRRVCTQCPTKQAT